MIIGKPKKTIGASMRSIILILSLHVVRDILVGFSKQGLNVPHILIIDFAGVLFGKVFNCHVVTIPHTSDKSKSFFVFIYYITSNIRNFGNCTGGFRFDIYFSIINRLTLQSYSLIYFFRTKFLSFSFYDIVVDITNACI